MLAAFEQADGSWSTGCWRVGSVHACCSSPYEIPNPYHTVEVTVDTELLISPPH